MNPSTERALRRLLHAIDRPPRRRRGSGRAAVVLAMGLVLGYQLLVRLLPRVWGGLLPGGLEQAGTLRGWPGVLWGLAVACHRGGWGVVAVGTGVVVAAIVLGRLARPVRWLVWLAAVGVILADALILAVILRTALEANVRASGLG